MSSSKSLPIDISNLSKSYGLVKALDDVSLNISAGEFLTLLGPSGSGKTTLLMALAGFVRPNSGSIQFGGQEVIATPPHERGLGMVFQSYALFPFMTVAENVAYPLKVRGVSKSDQKIRAERALETVQLGEYGDRRITQLSGGQRQRVALARAMVFEPQIILMDEPLSALDKKLREHMQIELKALHQKLDATDFIGESVSVPIDVENNSAKLNGRKIISNQSIIQGSGKHHLIIRPELLEVISGAIPKKSNDLSGKVHDIIYQGDSVLVIVQNKKLGLINVRVPANRAGQTGLPSRGEKIGLALHPEDTIIVPEHLL